MSLTYETFVKEMLDWFPFLSSECDSYMDEDEPLPYLAVGCVLNPWIEARLAEHDVANILRACQFLEIASTEGRSDARLAGLIRIEIGEWLPEVEERSLLLSHFGSETRILCSYHISRLPD
jgi:hypothetical protein